MQSDTRGCIAEIPRPFFDGPLHNSYISVCWTCTHQWLIYNGITRCPTFKMDPFLHSGGYPTFNAQNFDFRKYFSKEPECPNNQKMSWNTKFSMHIRVPKILHGNELKVRTYQCRVAIQRSAEKGIWVGYPSILKFFFLTPKKLFLSVQRSQLYEILNSEYNFLEFDWYTVNCVFLGTVG